MIKRYIELFKVCNDLRSEFRDQEVCFKGQKVLVIDIQPYYTKNQIQLVTQDQLMTLTKTKFNNEANLKASLT